MGTLGDGVAELLEDFLEAGFGLTGVLLLKRGIGVDLEQLYLLVDVVDYLLEVALLSVGWEIQRLKGRKGTHHLFIG